MLLHPFPLRQTILKILDTKQLQLRPARSPRTSSWSWGVAAAAAAEGADIPCNWESTVPAAVWVGVIDMVMVECGGYSVVRCIREQD